MKKVFADTSYWIALLNKNDQYHASALALDNKLEGIEIFTTDMVLAEVLNSFSSQGQFMKKLVANYVSHLYGTKGYSIIEQSREQFINALRIYSRYADKDWGFVDCLSYVIVPATPYLCRWHRFANMNLLQLLSASGVKAVGNLGRLNSVSLFRYYFLQLPAALSICPAKTDRSEKWVLPADGQVYL